MPIYVYKCESCDEKFEARQSHTDDHLGLCTLCGEPKVRRVIVKTSVVFRGSGFYSTDQPQR